MFQTPRGEAWRYLPEFQLFTEPYACQTGPQSSQTGAFHSGSRLLTALPLDPNHGFLRVNLLGIRCPPERSKGQVKS